MQKAGMVSLQNENLVEFPTTLIIVLLDMLFHIAKVSSMVLHLNKFMPPNPCAHNHPL